MCAAEKGNTYWLKRTEDGRKKLFETPESFLNAALGYFKEVDENPWIKKEVIKGGMMAGEIVDVPTSRPYTIEGLCIYLGISRQTFLNYEKDENYKDYFEVLTYIREKIELNQLEGATVGAYSATIIARKLGLVDRKEQDHKSKDGSMTPKYTIEVIDNETKENLDKLNKKS